MHGLEVDDFKPHDENYYSTVLLVPNLIPLTIGTPGTAVAYAIVGTDGTITGTYIKTAGAGASGTVTISPTYFGTGATFTPTYAAGALTAIAITAAGSGYTNIAPIGSTASVSLNNPIAELTAYITPTILTSNGWTVEGSTVAFA